VHDIIDLEARGIPGAYAASDAFRRAGIAQAEALGYTPAAVFVPHPVQDRTDEEIRAMAANVESDLLACISGAAGPGEDRS
jgi:hypothetical protein